LAIIRAELQVVCFSHLHILATLRSLQFSAQRLKREQRQQQQQQQQQQQGSGGNANGLNNSSLSSRGDSGEDDSHEAEAIINDLVLHLRLIVQSIKPALTSEALAVVLAPICFLVPRLLLKYVESVFSM
jgi:hypothetical protein